MSSGAIVSPTKILIDTDIGDDIDDAQALVLAMKSTEVEIVGVTTVFKNVLARARIAKRLLDFGGYSKVPVICGYGQPFKVAVDVDEIPCQYQPELDDLTLSSDCAAVDFICDSIMSNPNEVTIVAIGPLTNIAWALRAEPRIQDSIKELIWMGGAFYYHFRTWNAMCDPEAARIVFDSHIPLRVVSRDVCIQCRLDKYQIETLLNTQGQALQYLMQLTDLWQMGADRYPVLFDPLALTSAFDNRFLTFNNERVGVELEGEFTRGMTFVYDELYERRDMLALASDQHLRVQRPVQVAHSVQSQRFIEFFLERMIS